MKYSNPLKKIAYSLILMLIGLPAFAQNIVNTDDIRDMVNYNIVPTFQKTNVEGTPYISDDFTTGSFELYSGAKTEDLTLNYNIYENRVEIYDDGQVYAVATSDIRQFRIEVDGKEHVFKKGFESRRLEPNQFVEVVVEGPMSFLVKHEVNFSENSSSGYGSATKENVYSQNQRYYFQKDGEMHALRRLKSRRIAKYFDGDKQVNAYIKKNNLDLSNPADIAKAVEKYNSINS